VDSELAADVSDELFWDPKLDNSSIAVAASDGTIILVARSGAWIHPNVGDESDTARVASSADS